MNQIDSLVELIVSSKKCEMICLVLSYYFIIVFSKGLYSQIAFCPQLLIKQMPYFVYRMHIQNYFNIIRSILILFCSHRCFISFCAFGSLHSVKRATLGFCFPLKVGHLDQSGRKGVDQSSSGQLAYLTGRWGLEPKLKGNKLHPRP